MTRWSKLTPGQRAYWNARRRARRAERRPDAAVRRALAGVSRCPDDEVEARIRGYAILARLRRPLTSEELRRADLFPRQEATGRPGR